MPTVEDRLAAVERQLCLHRAEVVGLTHSSQFNPAVRIALPVRQMPTVAGWF